MSYYGEATGKSSKNKCGGRCGDIKCDDRCGRKKCHNRKDIISDDCNRYCYPPNPIMPCIPCAPQYGCGSKYIEWIDCNKTRFRSKIVSETNISTLNATLSTIGLQLTMFYNSGLITPAQISSLGLFNLQSTMVDFTNTPAVTTYIGDIDISTIIATILSTTKTNNPTSTILVSTSAQLLTNDLANMTMVINVNNGILPVSVITLVFLIKSNNCGASPPSVVSGTMTRYVYPLPA